MAELRDTVWRQVRTYSNCKLLLVSPLPAYFTSDLVCNVAEDIAHHFR